MTDKPKPADIVREENAQLDFSQAMTYGDYLQLDALTARKNRCHPTTTKCCSSSSTRPASFG